MTGTKSHLSKSHYLNSLFNCDTQETGEKSFKIVSDGGGDYNVKPLRVSVSFSYT